MHEVPVTGNYCIAKLFLSWFNSLEQFTQPLAWDDEGFSKLILV